MTDVPALLREARELLEACRDSRAAWQQADGTGPQLLAYKKMLAAQDYFLALPLEAALDECERLQGEGDRYRKELEEIIAECGTGSSGGRIARRALQD